ncbi:hypothetical protein MTP99_011529 [Tenebrio molitor]|nr:hypothetical protein MTP99_011529 [Tenebrio molitor]
MGSLPATEPQRSGSQKRKLQNKIQGHLTRSYKVEGPFNKAQPLDNVQDRSSSNTSGSTTSSVSDIFEGAKKNHAISSQVLGER